MKKISKKEGEISLTIIYYLAFVGLMYLLFQISDIFIHFKLSNILLYFIWIISWGMFIKLALNVGDLTNKSDSINDK